MLPSQFCKLLSDETRVRCLLLIAREKGLCVGELTYALDENQSKISRHLAKLRQSNVLESRRSGQWVSYRVAENLPGWMNSMVNSLCESECLTEQYKGDVIRLNTMIDRPES